MVYSQRMRHTADAHHCDDRRGNGAAHAAQHAGKHFHQPVYEVRQADDLQTYLTIVDHIGDGGGIHFLIDKHMQKRLGEERYQRADHHTGSHDHPASRCA